VSGPEPGLYCRHATHNNNQEACMTEHIDPFEPGSAEHRRRFLRLAGTAAALLPIAVITGCGNDAPPPAQAAPASPPPAPRPAAQQSAAAEPEPATEAAAEAPAQELAELSLDDPTAQALGYQHDAAKVDAQRFPQRQTDQFCRNCTLFQGSGSDAWGPCNLFPGKKVNSGGWCSAYTPKPA
jgi:hypothetical protein